MSKPCTERSTSDGGNNGLCNNSLRVQKEKITTSLQALKKSLQKQQAKNILKLKKRTSKDRRLEKSSLSKSQKVEKSLYERTLLCNNRNLAQALEKMRRERVALQNQISDLNQEKLELEINLNHANCRLLNDSKRDSLKYKVANCNEMIHALSEKFMEAAEVMGSLIRNCADVNEFDKDINIDNGTHFTRMVTHTIADKPVRVSVSEYEAAHARTEASTFPADERRPNLDNLFDLSVISESAEASLMESFSIKGDNSKEKSVRRGTFVVQASRQIADLPSPMKKLNSKARMRRSIFKESTHELQNTIRQSSSECSSRFEVTSHIPVDMEFTQVLNTPIMQKQVLDPLPNNSAQDDAFNPFIRQPSTIAEDTVTQIGISCVTPSCSKVANDEPSSDRTSNSSMHFTLPSNVFKGFTERIRNVNSASGSLSGSIIRQEERTSIFKSQSPSVPPNQLALQLSFLTPTDSGKKQIGASTSEATMERGVGTVIKVPKRSSTALTCSNGAMENAESSGAKYATVSFDTRDSSDLSPIHRPKNVSLRRRRILSESPAPNDTQVSEPSSSKRRKNERKYEEDSKESPGLTCLFDDEVHQLAADKRKKSHNSSNMKASCNSTNGRSTVRQSARISGALTVEDLSGSKTPPTVQKTKKSIRKQKDCPSERHGTEPVCRNPLTLEARTDVSSTPLVDSSGSANKPKSSTSRSSATSTPLASWKSFSSRNTTPLGRPSSPLHPSAQTSESQRRLRHKNMVVYKEPKINIKMRRN